MSDIVEKQLFVAIDLGSYSFKLAVASLNSEGELLVLHAIEEIASDGLKKGAVTTINKVCERLEFLVNKIVEKNGYQIKNVRLCYSSEHVDGVNSSGVAGIGERGKGRPITEEDRQNVLTAVQAVVIGEDKEIAHIIPSRYIVDNQDLVKDPIGMVAVRLEAEAHLIIVNEMLLNNLQKTCNLSGLNVVEMIYSPLAASEIVLTKNERMRGVVYIDIGFNLTKILFFKNDSLYYSEVLPIGANSITTDLAYMLKIESNLAEKLKKEHGCAYLPLLDRDDYAYIPSNNEMGPESISERYMCEIIMARSNDIFLACKNMLEKKGWLKEANCVVIGGGGGNLSGISELASKVFNIPSHTAVCGSGFENLNEEQRSSEYGSVLGILKNILKFQKKTIAKSPHTRHNVSMKNGNIFTKFLKSILKDIF